MNDLRLIVLDNIDEVGNSVNNHLKVIMSDKAMSTLKKGQNSFDGGCSTMFAWLFCKFMGLFGKAEHRFPRVEDKFDNRFIEITKDNKSELEEALDITINSKEDAIRYARYLQRFGARNVIVSLSGDGAIFVSEEGESFSLDVPPGKLVNAVGAGDSMIAGFLAGWENTKDYSHAFHMAVATGSASAFSEEFATKDAVEKLLKHFK